MRRTVLWAAGLCVGTSCAGAPVDDDATSPGLSPTPDPQASDSPGSEVTPTPEPTPFPRVRFEILPAEINVPLGGQQTFVAANYGVPLEDITWHFQYNDPNLHGNFDSSRGIYSAPEKDNPGSLGLSANWVDPDGVLHEANAVINISNWAWLSVGGPGPGCDTCPIQTGGTDRGEFWLNRPGEGIWVALPSFVGPTGAGGGGGPNCGNNGEDPTRVTGEAAPPPDPARAEAKGSSGDWRHVSGPWGGDHADLRLFPMAGDVSQLLALSHGILYRSPDGGYSWVQLPIQGEVTAVAPYPGSSREVMVAVERSGLHLLGRSVDGGQTFGWWPSDMGERVEVLSQVPQLNVRVLAATESGLFVSNDEGLTFTPALVGSLGVKQLLAWPLAVAWALTHVDDQRRLLRSLDGGATWEEAQLVPDCQVTSLARDPHNAEHFMLGCLGGYPQETFDGGEHFNLSNTGLPPELPPDTETLITYADVMPIVHLRFDHQDHFYFFVNVDGWLPLSPGPGSAPTSLRSGLIRRPSTQDESGFALVPGLLAGNSAGWLEMTVSPTARKWASYGRPFVDEDVAIRDISFNDADGFALIATDSGVYGSAGVEGAWSRVEALEVGDDLRVVEVQQGVAGTGWAGTSAGDKPPLYAAVGGQWQDGDILPAEQLRADGGRPGHVYARVKGAVWFSEGEGRVWQRLDLGEEVEVLSLETGPDGVLAGTTDGIKLLRDGEFRSVDLSSQSVGPVCSLPDDELGPDLPPGMAAVVGGVLMIMAPGSSTFGEVDGLNYHAADGNAATVKVIQPQIRDRGLIYALVEQLGLFVVGPAPLTAVDDGAGEPLPTCPPMETETPRQ